MVGREGSQPRPLLPGPQLHHPVQPAHGHNPPRHIEGQGADGGSWSSQFLPGEVETEMSGLLSTQPEVTQNVDVHHSPPSTPTSVFLPLGHTGPSHLGDSESVHLEEAAAASPAAYGYHLPLWVKSNTIHGLGRGVLGGQLPMDCVPQLEEREGRKTEA